MTKEIEKLGKRVDMGSERLVMDFILNNACDRAKEGTKEKQRWWKEKEKGG